MIVTSNTSKAANLELKNYQISFFLPTKGAEVYVWAEMVRKNHDEKHFLTGSQKMIIKSDNKTVK